MGRQRLVRGEGRPRQEEWVQTETDQGQTAGLHETPSRERHVSVLLPLPPSAALSRPYCPIVSETPVRLLRGRRPGHALARDRPCLPAHLSALASCFRTSSHSRSSR